MLHFGRDIGGRAAVRRAPLGSVLAIAVLLGACGPGGVLPMPGQMPTPQTPEREGGLIAVSAVSSTVRPERRDFSEERMRQLRVPAGFQINVFARDLENPRIIEVAENGNVYVTEREAGRVRLLRDTNGDGRADVSRAVATGIGEGLEGVHGLAIRGNRLYMITNTELYSAPIQADGGLGERTRHIDDIPEGGQHPNRTMRWGPDGRLYISIGSQTNAIPEAIDELATMVRVNPQNWEREIYAEGLRNTIGFDWHPTTGHLWGLDHNSDHRGDNWPPEELNRIQQGRHYGWPWCGGDREVDWHVPSGPDEQDRRTFCAQTEPPVLTYTAHAAPMQMAFYRANQFPQEYRNNAFVTMRGSWNRNPPIGYEVVRIRFDQAGNPTEMESFVSGWLLDGGRAHFGRLTGLAVAGDGSLLVSDDTNGVIYRISHAGAR